VIRRPLVIGLSGRLLIVVEVPVPETQCHFRKQRRWSRDEALGLVSRAWPPPGLQVMVSFGAV